MFTKNLNIVALDRSYVYFVAKSVYIADILVEIAPSGIIFILHFIAPSFSYFFKTSVILTSVSKLVVHRL